MQLFERIKKLYDALGLTQNKFAKKIGVKPNTFSGYMNEEGQSKIRFDHLCAILKIFPHVNRDWLFFGEGPMFGESEGASPGDEAREKERIELELLRENRELMKENRDLRRELDTARDDAGIVEEGPVPGLGCVPSLRDQKN